MNGKRLRVSGTLRRGKRGLILATDTNELWVVETEDDVAPLLGQRVTIEGTTAGLDRLKADWIGVAE